MVAAPLSSLSERRPRIVWAPLVLVLVDLLVLEAAVLCGVVMRSLLAIWLPIGIGAEVYSGAMVAVACILAGYWLAGLYPGYGLTGVERLRLRTIVTSIGFGSLILFDYIAQNGQWSRGILLIAAGTCLVAGPVADALTRGVLVWRGVWGAPVAVFGPPEHRHRVIDRLNGRPDIGWIPVYEADEPVAVDGASFAVFAVPSIEALDVETIDHLPYRGMILVLSGVVEWQNLWVSARDVGACMGLEMRRNLLVGLNMAIKRGVDLALVLTFGLCAVPIIAVFALLVRIVSPGPAFFLQWREGQGGRPFRFIKLRTMRVDADTHPPPVPDGGDPAVSHWQRGMKRPDDPRIIPGLGHFMRRFSIDELPQLLNVLRGEMSLVGPRPLPAYHIAALDPASCRLRRMVRPGLSGLWQVSGRSLSTLDEQQALDSYYVRNWSIWLDFHILARSVAIVLTGRGAW
ncbi:sugar transferase [Azospirillum sp. 11R-A]|uniref:sugar transferase n=1 Tax=Azospirillum sp. 11R-A TaxID=3111634 RepID=UPI003C1BFA3D